MTHQELHLPEKPTLQDFQDYVAELVEVRKFNTTVITATFLRFSEEVGELAKAIRQQEKMHSDITSSKYGLEEELADVFIYLLDIANYFQIDLEKAFRAKEEINKQRTWQ